jgi:uncharacterized Rmd1/YagE family protein
MSTTAWFPNSDAGRVRALLVGERIDVRKLESRGLLANGPLVTPVDGGGAAVLFRFGVVVLTGATAEAQATFLEQIGPQISGRYESHESEEVLVRVDPQSGDGVSGEVVTLSDQAIERYQLIADVLAKSVLLARYESEVAADFDRVEPIAATLQRTGRPGRSARGLLHHIGGSLLSEQRIVARAAVIEKPDLLWDNPALERFYVRLQDERRCSGNWN